MAQTAFTTSDTATVKLWEQKHLFLEPMKQSFFANKMSESGDNFVYTNNKFNKEQGDRITFALIMRLSENWVTSGQTLEGSEDSLTKYTYNLTLEEYAAAVRDRGPLDRQRAMFSIDNVSQERLKKKIAEKIDTLLFDAIDTSPTKIFYQTTAAGITSTATAATAKAAIRAAESKLTPTLASAIKAWASTGGNRSQVPFEPVMSKGRPVYGLIVHPDVLYDWKQDSTWTQASREAEVRGKDNPLFTGAVGIWDGIALWENEKCPIGTDGGAGAEAWSRAYFMGAQALAWSWGKKPELTPETFDYKRQHGYGVSMICAAGKTQFNSKDFGCVSLYLTRTNLAGL